MIKIIASDFIIDLFNLGNRLLFSLFELVEFVCFKNISDAVRIVLDKIPDLFDWQLEIIFTIIEKLGIYEFTLLEFALFCMPLFLVYSLLIWFLNLVT